MFWQTIVTTYSSSNSKYHSKSPNLDPGVFRIGSFLAANQVADLYLAIAADSEIILSAGESASQCVIGIDDDVDHHPFLCCVMGTQVLFSSLDNIICSEYWYCSIVEMLAKIIPRSLATRSQISSEACKPIAWMDPLPLWHEFYQYLAIEDSNSNSNSK
jgi:hypothetical protein